MKLNVLLLTATTGLILAAALTSNPLEETAAAPPQTLLLVILGCLLTLIGRSARGLSAAQKTSSATLLLALLLPAAGIAQASASDWKSVIELKPGTGILLVHDGLKQSRGSFVSATDLAVTMRDKTGAEEVIAKNEIIRISSAQMTRKKRAVIGMTIGAVLATAAMAIGAKTGDIDVTHAVLLGGAAVAGAGTGAAIGAASGGPRVIYRASADSARAMAQKQMPLLDRQEPKPGQARSHPTTEVNSTLLPR